MKHICPFLLALTVFADTRPAVAPETLRYSVNWPSGLSLGEGTLTSAAAGPERWQFSLSLDAGVPGFRLAAETRAEATEGLCSLTLDKKLTRGPRQSDERTVFDPTARTAKRTTERGGSSDLSTPACPQDALTYLYGLRRTLSQGRLPAPQTVYYGAPYEVRADYGGAQTVQVGGKGVEVDRLTLSIKGPASTASAELFFARDAARTPVLAKVPLALGTFSLELVR